ncbi:hypothetical protein LTR97_000797 [Elasticomyces elasticus]|uniref:DOC domain-containing protein n=1 Tax=Elasticomyces elasticus TaxID=574655 RepID=A0AAN7ZR25_9PEZI|nr:hypothetical protein LTR97_000797 [Elasticomyces elasticus]
MPTATQLYARSRSRVLTAIAVPPGVPPNQQPILDAEGHPIPVDEDEETEEESDEEEEYEEQAGVEEEVEEQEEEEGQEEEEEEEDLSTPFPPFGLKEISSLASWTVSTAKPGNGVAALRSPDPLHYWQSDGPQPHLLSIHFFKLVEIASIEVLLDFKSDESYTPTKIQFLAGMGVYDIQEFAEMSFEQPTGWHEVDFSNVGPIDDAEESLNGEEVVDWSKRPVLRAFLLQVRILENHQNGKDTHLRGVRVFARDDTMPRNTEHSIPTTSKIPAITNLTRREKPAILNNIKMTSWMMDPDLR